MSLLQSDMHSHCFVRFESIYTPIQYDSERQKYLSIPCNKGFEEIRKFYKNISNYEHPETSEVNDNKVNEVAL